MGCGGDEFGLKLLTNTDEVVIEGEEKARDKAFRELEQGWYDDDFAKAKEVFVFLPPTYIPTFPFPF